MMTLDEAIPHCSEVAEELDRLATRYEDASGYTRSHIESLKTDQSIKCRECASDHRQLAEWLKTLKNYQKAREEINQEIINWNDIDNGKVRGLFLAESIMAHYVDGGDENDT